MSLFLSAFSSSLSMLRYLLVVVYIGLRLSYCDCFVYLKEWKKNSKGDSFSMTASWTVWGGGSQMRLVPTTFKKMFNVCCQASSQFMIKLGTFEGQSCTAQLSNL